MAKPAPRDAVVQNVQDITPNMRRITFGGPGMQGFPVGTEAGYIKLHFPDHPASAPGRPVRRTYSIRAIDAEAGQISVDFALHAATGGVAMDWAAAATPGAQMLLAGPGLVKMVPPAADWYLIAADMTGLPAALCNLERLPEGARGYGVFEVTSEADAQAVPVPEGFTVQWVVNPAPAERPGALLEAVKGLAWREGAPFVWTACEFDTMRALRSYYRTERGVAKGDLYLSSYWRAGRTEEQHKVDKRQDQDAEMA